MIVTIDRAGRIGQRPPPALAVAGLAVLSVAILVGAWFMLRWRDAGQHPAPPPAIAPPVAPIAAGRTSISGAPTVIDTATLEIRGRRVPLDGVIGLSGESATDLTLFLAEHGGQVNCQPRNASGYACSTRSGYDVAAAALVNGAAKAAPSASAQYREFEADARREHRGVWQ